MATRVRPSKTAPKSARPAATRAAKSASTKTKKELCIGLLRRPKGASLAELQRATGWQPHSVRGFLSGTVKKLPTAELHTEVAEGRPRRYRLLDQSKGSC